FKGRNDDLRTIGEKLGASNLLEGSVRKAGSRVRITAQLVEARGGSHLWSQSFDRDLTDVFAVQEEIARAVVTALKVKLLPGETPTAKDRRTANPDVYSRYLLGHHALNQANPDGWRRAVKEFAGAVALDPGYAPAWAGLAHAHAYVAGHDRRNCDRGRPGAYARVIGRREGRRACPRPRRRVRGEGHIAVGHQ